MKQIVLTALTVGLTCLNFAVTANPTSNEPAKPKVEAKPTLKKFSDSIQVMSFNITESTPRDGNNHWSLRRESTIQTIKDSSCTVIAVQEAIRSQVNDLKAGLPEYGIVEGSEASSRGAFNPILYKLERWSVESFGSFWLSDNPTQPYSSTWGNLRSNACTWAKLVEKATGATFYIYNAKFDRNNQNFRNNSALLITKVISGRPGADKQIPIIIAGDFACGADDESIAYLKSAAAPNLSNQKFRIGLQDTFTVANPKDTSFGSVHAYDGKTVGPRTDYLFATPDFKVKQAKLFDQKVAGRFPSTHFPIVATLAWEKAPAPKKKVEPAPAPSDETTPTPKPVEKAPTSKPVEKKPAPPANPDAQPATPPPALEDEWAQ